MSRMHSQETWVNTARGRLFVKSWQADTVSPKRAPIIMQHDSLGCVTLWRDLPERMALATGRRIVAYDRLGFGRSDPHPDRVGFDLVHAEATGDFRLVRDALHIGKFVAFGHSVGGGMSMACAAVHRSDCVGLITESAHAFVEPHTVEGVRQTKAMFARPGELDRLKKYHGDKAAWVLEAWTATWLAPAFADWTLDPFLREVQCPVLSFHGDCDEYGTLAHLHRIQAATHATPVVMRGCGHVPHREQPGAFIAAIEAWLQSIE
ncbi:alpha/beta fold hydrolase [Bordetella sp. 02P26C-1]|nr:alpha/beta hydrolase [Bordetella sp. 02P26C-1]MVW79465.1 alpha/beta fold hydrolase [Bordetella sp. 02P26C-1]